MSTELQELIHRTSMIAMAQGERKAEARIIKLLDVLATQEPPFAQTLINNLKILIKGENK